MVLVGDSCEQVVHGRKSTASITMELMLAHCAAVRRGISEGLELVEEDGAATRQPLLVVDIPLLASTSDAVAVDAATRLAAAGAGAVKIEGGASRAQRIASITREGISVMGHVGLLPQTAETS